MSNYFNTAQLPFTNKAFSDAEKVVSRHFRMSEDQLRQNKYDVKTLAYLTQHEVKDGAFAHLCKYSFEKPANSEQKDKEKSGYYADPYNIPSE